MAIGFHAEQVIDLALVPVGAWNDVGHRRHRWIRRRHQFFNQDNEVLVVERVHVTDFVVSVDRSLVRAYRHHQPGMQRVEEIIRHTLYIFSLYGEVKPVGPRLLTLEQRYRKPLLHSGKHTFRGCHFTPPASQNTSAIESAQPSTCQSKYI